MSGTRNLDGLKTQALTCVEAAYDKGYKNGLNDGNINDGTFAAKVKEAYNNGLNDAWECARKILNATVPYDYWDMGSGRHISDAIRCYSAQEAMQKIKEYEDKQKKTDDEIHIGDEVYALDENKRKTVTAIDGNIVIVLSASGKYGTFNISELHKTGRRFVIDEILKELKGE